MYINRKQFQFTRRRQTLTQPLLLRSRPSGFHGAFGKVFSNSQKRKQHYQPCVGKKTNKIIIMPLYKTTTPAFWKACEILIFHLRNSWKSTGTKKTVKDNHRYGMTTVKKTQYHRLKPLAWKSSNWSSLQYNRRHQNHKRHWECGL